MGGRRIAVFLVVLSLLTGLLAVDPLALAQDSGSHLTHDVTASDPPNGGSLQLENVASFDANGGEAVFEPGTSAEENFSYEGLNTTESQLVGVIRNNPVAHPALSFVAVVKQADPSPSPTGESSPTADSSPIPTESASPEPTETSDPQVTDSTTTSSESTTTSTSSTTSATTIVDELVYSLCQQTLVCETVSPEQIIQDLLGSVGDPCNGAPPDECLIGSVDIGPLIQQILQIVDGYRYELCGYDTWDECASRVALDVVASVSAIVTGAVNTIYKAVCGTSTTSGCLKDYENKVTLLVNNTLAMVCKGTSSGAPGCVEYVNTLVASTVMTAYRIACPSDTTSDACVNRYITTVVGIVNGAVNTVYKAVCGTSTTSGCLKDYENKVTLLVNNTLDMVCKGTSSGAPGCVEYVNTLVASTVMTAYKIACPSDTSTDACADRYIATASGIVTGAIDTVYTALCGTSTATSCIEDYENEVALLVNNSLDGFCNGTSSGATGCVEHANALAAATIDAAYRAACPSDASLDACLGRYNSTVTGVVDAAVNTIYGVACPTDSTTSQCANEYLAAAIGVISQSVETAYRVLCPTDTSSDTCLARYQALVENITASTIDTVYRLACPTDLTANACVGRYVNTVTTTVQTVVDTGYRTACPTDVDVASCVHRHQLLLETLAGGLIAQGQDIVCPNDPSTDACAARYLEALRQLIDQLSSVAGSLKAEADKILDPGLLTLLKAIYDLVAAAQMQLGEATKPCGAGGTLDLLLQECTLPGGPGGPTKLTFVGPDGSPLAGAAVAVYLDPFNPPCSFQPPLLARGYTDSSGTLSFDVLKALALSPAAGELLPDLNAEDSVNTTVMAVDPVHLWRTQWGVVTPLFEPYEETVPVDTPVDELTQAATATDDELINILRVEVENEWANDGGDPQAIEAAAAGPEPDPVHPEDVGGLSTSTSELSDLDACFGPAAVTSPDTQEPTEPAPAPEPSASPSPEPAPEPSPSESPGASAPAAPTSLTAQAISDSRIDIAWTDNSTDEAGFRILRYSEGDVWKEIAVVAPGTTAYSDSGLAGSTTYWYVVRAYNDGGSSDSNVASASTQAPPAPPPPNAPSALTATAASSSQIDISWIDNSTNEKGFRIERSVNSGEWAEIALVAAGQTTYSDPGLSAQTTYSYRVRAYNAGGNSGYSSTASAATPADPAPAPPAAPSSLRAASMSSTSIRLTWSDNSSNEYGFKVERSKGGSDWIQVATVAASVTTYDDGGLAAGTTYSYRVRAYHSTGHSAYSNWASAATPGHSSGSDSTDEHRNYSYSYEGGSGTAEDSSGDCWEKCKVAMEKRLVKVSQHHNDKGLRSTFQFLDGRETTTGIAVKTGGGNWRAGGSMEEQIKRGTDIARTLKGNNKHVLWLAEYRWYKWKYTQVANTGGKFHSWEWKNHNFTGDIVRSPDDPSYPAFDQEYSAVVRRADGDDWSRYSQENRKFEVGVSIAGISLMSRAGYARNTALRYNNVGNCEARDTRRWVYGQRQDPTVSPVIYAWSFCI